MQESTRRTIRSEAELLAMVGVGGLSAATGNEWVLVGMLGVLTDIFRHYRQCVKNDKLGSLLTSSETARLRKLVHQSRQELNEIMSIRGTGLDDKWYRWCNDMHNRITALHTRLDPKQKIEIRAGEQKDVEADLRRISTAYNTANRSKRG